MSALQRYPKFGTSGSHPRTKQALGERSSRMATTQSHQNFVPVKRLIIVIDLAGFTKAAQSAGDAKIVAFLQEYYAACEEVLNKKDGMVIKFMGDACLSIFPPE